MTDDQGANLTNATFGGMSWTVGSRVLGLVAQLGYTSVMARLLSPEVFGLVAAAQVVLLGGQIVAELGIGRAMVQKDSLSREEIRAGFTASVILGLGLTAVVVALAPAVALLFRDAGVAPVVRGFALVLIATTAGLTAQSVLLRELRFKVSALLELGSFVVGYLIVGVGLAIAGAGVWSMVAAAVSKAAIHSTAALLVARHDMRPLLSWTHVRSLMSFGSQVSFISVVEFLTLAAPPTAIGRLLTPATLGQFNQANKVVELPFINLSQALTDVLFPAVSRIRRELDRVGGAYLTALRVTSGLLLPTAGGVAVAAPELVAVLLGDQWGPAAQVLPVLAFHAAVMMLALYAAVVCEAMAILKVKLVIQILTLGALVVGFVVLQDQSLVVMAVMMLVVQLGRMLAYWWLMHRRLQLSPSDQPRAVAGALAGAVITAGTIGLLALAGRALGLPDAVVLAGEMLVGGVTLLWLMFYGPLRATRDDLVIRLVYAGFDGRGGAMGRLMRLLRTGQRPSGQVPAADAGSVPSHDRGQEGASAAPWSTGHADDAQHEDGDER